MVAALSLWLGFSASLFEFLLILTLIIAGWWIGVALSQRMLSRPVSWELPFVPIIIPVFVYTLMQSELYHLIASSLQGIKA